MERRLLVGAIAVCLAATGSAQNLLVNPGLETGSFSGWQHNSGELIQSGWFWGAGPHSGQYGLGAASNWLTNPAEIFQEVPVTPGMDYEASGWFWFFCTSSNCDFTTVQVQLAWLNSGGSVISLEDSGLIDALTTGNEFWFQVQNVWTAPPTAAQARFVVNMFVNGSGAGGWAVACGDDFVLQPAGEVPTPTPICDNDIDGDNVCDEQEGPNIGLPAGSSNILLVDSDGDGLLDGVEDANRNGSKDANESSTRNRDTDGDNFEDGIEVLMGQDPLVANAGYADADGDGLPDALDPNDAAKDSDADGFDDGYEAAWFQNVAAVSSAAQKPPLADVNGDASVANLDALVMQALFLGIIDHTAAVFDQGPAHTDGFRFGDPSRDGFVTSLDALVAQSFFLGNLTTLPLRF